MICSNSLSAALASASLAILPAFAAFQPTDPAAQPGSRDTTQPDRDASKSSTNDMKRDGGVRVTTGNDAWRDAAPGEMHEWLKKLDGSWNISAECLHDGRMDMSNASDTNKSRNEADKYAKTTGTAKTDIVLDGRYAHMMVTHSGKPIGADRKNDNANRENPDSEAGNRSESFEGMQLIGYNNQTRKFESIWTDNQCTGVTVLTGELDAERKVLTLTNDNVTLDRTMASGTAATGTGAVNSNNSIPAKKGNIRQIIRWTGPSSFVTEVYKTGESGSEDKQMVITFTKRDAGSMGAAPVNP